MIEMLHISYIDNLSIIAYPPVLDSIGEAVNVVHKTETSFVRRGLVSKGSTALIEVEKLLLELAAYEDLTQGVFYKLRTSADGCSCVRFFESGSFLGAMQKMPASADVAYRVYSEDDVAVEARSLHERRMAISRKRTSGHPKGTHKQFL
jgi:hypothetical protein